MLDDGFVKEAKYETIKPDSKKGYEFSVLTTERHIYLQAETGNVYSIIYLKLSF